MKHLARIAAAAIFCVSMAVPGCTPGQIPSAKDVVSPAAYASYDPVAKGHELQLAVVLKIRDGYHINARKPTLEYLIPTDLKFELPAGFKAGEVVYPDGKLRTFEFSKKDQLNVYEGTAILRVPISVDASVPSGAQSIPLKLRYQACSNEVCLPPVTLNLAATIRVVALPSAAKPAHQELFAKP